MPWEPVGRVVVEMLKTVTTVRLICACAVSGPPAAVDESVTCTVKFEVPEMVGSPLMAPEAFNDRPVGKAPLTRLQVSGALPTGLSFALGVALISEAVDGESSGRCNRDAEG